MGGPRDRLGGLGLIFLGEYSSAESGTDGHQRQ